MKTMSFFYHFWPASSIPQTSADPTQTASLAVMQLADSRLFLRPPLRTAWPLPAMELRYESSGLRLPVYTSCCTFLHVSHSSDSFCVLIVYIHASSV
jgi:hypothetical protein